MCVGVTVTLAPPTAAVCGYYLWYSGQNVVLSSSWIRQGYHQNDKPRFHADTPPPQTFVSYAIGLATVSGMYLTLDHMICKWEQQQQQPQPQATKKTNSSNNNKYFLPHKASAQEQFRPPQTIHELVARVGPPLLSRLAAASVSFSCAGAVQTCVAASMHPYH